MTQHKMHPNSLKNIEGAKPIRGYGNINNRLPEEKVDALYKLLVEGSSLSTASKQLQITFKTARRYFEQGDPRRGLKPLKFRLMLFQEKKGRQLDGQLLKRRNVLLKTVTTVLDQLQKQVDGGLLVKKATLSQLDKLIRLEMYLRGIGESGSERTSAILSAEEIRLLATDGDGTGDFGGRGEGPAATAKD